MQNDLMSRNSSNLKWLLKRKKIKEKQEVKNLHVCAQNRETARCVKGTQSRDQLAPPLSHQSRFVPHPQSLQSHF